MSFLIWPCCFNLLGAIGSCPLLFLNCILDTFRPGGLIFGVISFYPFKEVMRFSQQVYWGSLPFPPPVNHVLSELSTMTHSSWVALHGMIHSFIELFKPFHHKAVICEGSVKDCFVTFYQKSVIFTYSGLFLSSVLFIYVSVLLPVPHS